MGLYLVQAPSGSEKIVTTDEAKAHLRVSHAADDSYIDSLVKVAVGESEDYTQRRFITQRWKMTLDDWPECGAIALCAGPVTQVHSVKYYDTDGTLVTWNAAEYQSSLKGDQSEPSYITLGPGTYLWPSLQLRKMDAIEVEYQVGWANSAVVPQRIKQAILVQVAEMYSVRHPVERKFGILDTSERLLYPFRIMEFL